MKKSGFSLAEYNRLCEELKEKRLQYVEMKKTTLENHTFVDFIGFGLELSALRMKVEEQRALAITNGVVFHGSTPPLKLGGELYGIAR